MKSSTSVSLGIGYSVPGCSPVQCCCSLPCLRKLRVKEGWGCRDVVAAHWSSNKLIIWGLEVGLMYIRSQKNYPAHRKFKARHGWY